MSCEYCLKIDGKHDYRCPNYVPPKYKNYCSICGEVIQNGEEYIEKYNGECIHLECIQGIRWLIQWLGEEIKEEGEINEC